MTTLFISITSVLKCAVGGLRKAGSIRPLARGRPTERPWASPQKSEYAGQRRSCHHRYSRLRGSRGQHELNQRDRITPTPLKRSQWTVPMTDHKADALCRQHQQRSSQQPISPSRHSASPHVAQTADLDPSKYAVTDSQRPCAAV